MRRSPACSNGHDKAFDAPVRSAADRSCRQADRDTVIRYVGSHDGIGPHFDAIADANVAKRSGPGREDHIVADGRVAIGLIIAPACTADCNLLIYRAVAADARTGPDHDSDGMRQFQAGADPGTGLNETAEIATQAAIGPISQAAKARAIEMLRQTDQRHRAMAPATGMEHPQCLQDRHRPGPTKGIECQCL